MTNCFSRGGDKNEVVVNAADTALTTALESLARRMDIDSFQAVDCLQHGDHNAWSSFYYDLSKQIAGQIGNLNEDVKAAYIDEYDVVPEDSFFGETARTTVICLIVWVQHKTDMLMNSLVVLLDQALVQKFNDLIGKPRLTHLLEVQIFDDADAKNPTGYGAWLTSDYFYLTKVWRRKGVKLELYQSQ